MWTVKKAFCFTGSIRLQVKILVAGFQSMTHFIGFCVSKGEGTGMISYVCLMKRKMQVIINDYVSQ